MSEITSAQERHYKFIDPANKRGPDIDDITMEIHYCSFEKAIEIIKASSPKYQPRSVLLFRGVVNPIDINLKNYLIKLEEHNKNAASKKGNESVDKGIKQQVHCERLQKVANGVFYNENVRINSEENSILLKRILEENITLNMKNKDEEWWACVNAIEDLFEEFEDDTKRHAYIRDCELAPDESTCSLSNIESYISINPDRNIEEMPGINTSMHYIGEKGSYTALHEEDGGLSSLNLLKYGHPKLWLIIDYRWRAEVENNVVTYLKEKCPKKKVCDQILKHKIYLLTPKFLNDFGIPYSIVLQKPGDLFFIRAGTYHCVINMGKNVAEAVNIGCDEWIGSYEPIPCNCKENNKKDVIQDRRVVVVSKAAKKRHFECDDDNCSELFVTKKKLICHMKNYHTKRYDCSVCKQSFSSEMNLKRHARKHSGQEYKIECDICHKKVLRIAEHKRNTHGERSMCMKCGKIVNQPALKRHQELCQKECPICSKMFSSQRYLTMHINSKHNR